MKKLILILNALLLTLLLTACLPSDYENVNDTPDETLPAPQTYDELYSLYDFVQRDMTKAELEEKFGEGSPSYDEYGDIKFFNYYNAEKSAGVSIIYKNDIVETKMLYFNKKANLVPFSGRFNDALVPEIKSNMTVEDAVKLMNSTPLELSCTYNPEGPLDMAKIYCWYNEDSSNFMMHTENGVISNVALYRS